MDFLQVNGRDFLHFYDFTFRKQLNWLKMIVSVLGLRVCHHFVGDNRNWDISVETWVVLSKMLSLF